MKRFYEVTREQTNDFLFREDNRQINRSHLNKIKEQMMNPFSNFPPITINEKTKRVIDGQHRLQAFKELVDDGTLAKDSTISVMYVSIDENQEKDVIINANTVSKNWAIDDYVVSYAKENINYQKLDEFCLKHTLCYGRNIKKYRYAIAMLKGTTATSSTEPIRNGSLTITDEDLKKGDIIHTELLEIIKTLNKPIQGSFIESMAKSWNEVRHLHPFKDWLKEIKRKKNVLLKKQFSTKKEWDIIFGILHRSIDINN